MTTDDAHADFEKCMDVMQNTPVTLHYLAEGNANVIYAIGPSTSSPLLSVHEHCCVLRMRKNLPTTRPCIENWTAIQDRITPLFGNDHDHALMPKLLYRLDSNVLQQATDILDDRHQRPTQTHTPPGASSGKQHVGHPSLTEEPHALLMPNLRHGDDALFREFKPKWLRQSPNAPQDARRCRTCAANALRRAQGGKRGKGDSGFCPLDLLSSDKSIIQTLLQKIDPELGKSDELVAAFIQRVQPVLHHLAELQSRHDTKGIDDASNPDQRDYAVAMALRDCSVFMVLKKRSIGQQDWSLAHVKLADLDLKISSAANRDKWAKMESDLISSGAYTNASMPDSACALERSPSSFTSNNYPPPPREV